MRLILVGGGLANSLIAYRLAACRPEVDWTILEAGPALGGNHTWSFHASDLDSDQNRWIEPFLEARWSSYAVRFPGHTRTLALGYASASADRLRAVMAPFAARVRTQTAVAALDPRRVRLADGGWVEGDAVLDGRGYRPSPHMQIAYQKFLGQELRTATPHGVEVPVVMDARVAQHDGFRFVYLLPFDAHRLLVEDTYYSDRRDLDAATIRDNIRDYAAARGWQVAEVLREEAGVLPIGLGGDIGAFWAEARGVARSGLAAGLYHPTTGYSLPDAVRLADAVAALPVLSAETLLDLTRRLSVAHWHRSGFYRLLDRLLFQAADPDGRYRLLERFYRFSPGLVARFYAGRSTGLDKLRVLSGRPPVPLGRAAVTARRKAIVIGSGFGGLALAIRLQAGGFDVTVLEKRDKPGGRAYVYEDGGFTFDGGPTVITDPTCLEELWTAAGRRMADDVTLLPVNPFYRLAWEDGFTFDYANDQAALDRQIAAVSPGDVAGYRRFLAFSEAVLEKGYVGLGSVPFLDFRSMVQVAPALVKLQSYRSVYALVSRFIRDEHLRQAFSFHTLLVGGNPFATSSIYALIHALERRWGVWFPKGGTGALIRAMVKLFEDIGGTIRLEAPVAAIRTEGGRATGVVLDGGETLPADAVASNADVMHTYRDLLRADPRGPAEARRLASKRFSMSLFVVYFGLKGDHRGLAHHTVCFGPRYRALIAEIFGAPALAEDFSLYLHAPNASDPSLAPPGHSAYYVLSPVPHLGTAPIDWTREGPRYRDRILAYLEARYLPNLRRDLVVSRLLTPFDFRDELNSHLGSAFSLEPILTQSAWFRPHNRDAHVAGLYFTGAGTHPGAGVPGVVGSAKATAGLMLADAEAGAAA